MITGDMFTFAIIYIIVLFGFSQAYFFLYKGHENVDETPYGTYASTWMGLFQTTLGDYDVSTEQVFHCISSSVEPELFIDFVTLSRCPFFTPQYAQLNDISYPNLAKTVFIIFMIFVPILLLNMLIAMMGG